MRKLPNELGHLPAGRGTHGHRIHVGSYSHGEKKTQNGSENLADVCFKGILNWNFDGSFNLRTQKIRHLVFLSKDAFQGLREIATSWKR